jgi:hypothetical protein
MRIDLALLRRQKRHLIGLRFGSVVSGAQDDTVEGVLNLLDFIQDSIVAQGLAPESSVFAIRNDRPRRKIAGDR